MGGMGGGGGCIMFGIHGGGGIGGGGAIAIAPGCSCGCIGMCIGGGGCGGGGGRRRSAIMTFMARPDISIPLQRATAASAEALSPKVMNAHPRELPPASRSSLTSMTSPSPLSNTARRVSCSVNLEHTAYTRVPSMKSDATGGITKPASAVTEKDAIDSSYALPVRPVITPGS